MGQWLQGAGIGRISLKIIALISCWSSVGKLSPPVLSFKPPFRKSPSAPRRFRHHPQLGLRQSGLSVRRGALVFFLALREWKSILATGCRQ